MNCRFCGNTGLHEFVDLGHMPPSNSFLTKEQLELPETHYPLKLYVCDSCFLVQLPEYKKAVEIFGDDYVYYSSQSPANVSHAKEYVEMITERFHPKKVLEIGSNDGYMLWFFQRKECEVQGIDPAEGPCLIARKKGVPTVMDFFSRDYASHPANEGKYDLICGINVLAHQPDINDFVEGMKIALAPNGIITMEFPHLLNLIEQCQFDTIYHEHYEYFSLRTICEIFDRHGLTVFDCDEIPEHGGSLRIYAGHKQSIWVNLSANILTVIDKEISAGVFNISYYLGFQNKIDRIKTDIIRFLIEAKQDGKMVVGYGAPAKASTFLNYCGIKSDLLRFTIDRSPHKIGKYMPGCHLLVREEFGIKNLHPDYILILAWNLKEEVMNQLSYVKSWGGKFVVAIPELEVI